MKILKSKNATFKFWYQDNEIWLELISVRNDRNDSKYLLEVSSPGGTEMLHLRVGSKIILIYDNPHDEKFALNDLLRSGLEIA